MAYYYAGGGERAPPREPYTMSQGRQEKYAMPSDNIESTKVRPKWSWCSTVCSVISMVCCGSALGAIGLLCSVFSYVDHKTGDYSRARYKRRCAYGCAVTGILICLLLIAAVLVLYFAFPDILRASPMGFYFYGMKGGGYQPGMTTTPATQ